MPTDAKLAALIERGRGLPWNGYELGQMKEAGKYPLLRFVRERIQPENEVSAMEVPNLPELPSSDEARRSLALTLVRLVSDEGLNQETFDLEHEGNPWRVTVAANQPEDAQMQGERDFTERLAE